MVGLLIHNFNLPPGNWQLLAAPLYATVSHQFNGLLHFNYAWYPHRSFRMIEAGINGEQSGEQSQHPAGPQRPANAGAVAPGSTGCAGNQPAEPGQPRGIEYLSLRRGQFAVAAGRVPAGRESDGVVGRNLPCRSTSMRRWPGIAEQKDQLAVVLDRVAEIDGIQAEGGERAGGRRLASLPIHIAGELADFLARADANRRRRGALGGPSLI